MTRTTTIVTFALLVMTMTLSACHSQGESKDIRPWTEIEFNGRTSRALIDTGSSLSSIPKSWLSQRDIQSASRVKTRGAVGVYQADVIRIPGLIVAETETGPQKAFVTQDPPAVGTAALFSHTSLVLNKRGLALGIDGRKLCAGRTPITTVFDLDGRFFEDPISAIYLRLDVNGDQSDVMLDTGRSDTIVTFGTLSEVLAHGIPEILRERGSETGERSTIANPIDVTLATGKWVLKVPGRIYAAPSPSRARFILGAGILDYVSIVMAPKKGIGCLIPVSQQVKVRTPHAAP